MSRIRRRAAVIHPSRTLLLLAFVAASAPIGVSAQSRLLSDLGDGVLAFAVDGWDIVTFPKDLDRRGWLELGAVVGVGGVLYAVDGDIQDVVRRNRGDWKNRTLRDVGDFFEPIGLMGNTNRYYVGGVVVGYASGWKDLQHVSQDILTSHWLASMTRRTLREMVGRLRPEAGQGPRAFVFREGTSFPSGHASSAFQVAAVFSHHIDRWPATVALYGMAGTIFFQRIDSESHWASDSFIGAFWGWGIAKVVLRNAVARRRDGSEPGLRPMIDPRTGMLGFSLRM